MTIFRDILCAVDTREDCTAALKRAVTLAVNNQANLTVIDVVERGAVGVDIPAGGAASADFRVITETRHAQELDTLIEPYRQQVPIKTVLRKETGFLEIIHQVLHGGHDLVIKVPEKLVWLDRLFCSDDMNLLRQCPCPVWLVKPQADEPCRRILAAIDLDDMYPPAELELRQRLNQTVLEMAGSLALSDFAELHVVHVWWAIGESVLRRHTPKDEIIAYVEQVRQRFQVSLDGLMPGIADMLGKDAIEYIAPKMHLVKGSPRKEIPILAERLAADVIVMGTVARTGIPGFIMGNTAETILNQIDCSVLAVKPPGFETTVLMTD